MEVFASSTYNLLSSGSCNQINLKEGSNWGLDADRRLRSKFNFTNSPHPHVFTKVSSRARFDRLFLPYMKAWNLTMLRFLISLWTCSSNVTIPLPTPFIPAISWKYRPRDRIGRRKRSNGISGEPWDARARSDNSAATAAELCSSPIAPDSFRYTSDFRPRTMEPRDGQPQNRA